MTRSIVVQTPFGDRFCQHRRVDGVPSLHAGQLADSDDHSRRSADHPYRNLRVYEIGSVRAENPTELDAI